AARWNSPRAWWNWPSAYAAAAALPTGPCASSRCSTGARRSAGSEAGTRDQMAPIACAAGAMHINSATSASRVKVKGGGAQAFRTDSAAIRLLLVAHVLAHLGRGGVLRGRVRRDAGAN